ncbi:MAG: tetratricopeptide repeat protein [Burkholderiales bacterium]
MSAINQMLLELEKRRAPRPEGIASQAHALPAARRTLRPRWAALAGLLALVLAGFVGLALRSEPPVPVIAQVPAVSKPKPLAVEKTAMENPAVAESLLKPAARLSLELSVLPAESAPQPVTQAEPAKSKPAVAPKTKVAAAERETPAAINKQVRQQTPQQQAEDEYRKAAGFLQQGKTREAEENLRQSLRLNPKHIGARQTLAALALQERRNDDAENLLRAGLAQDSQQTGYAMMLARIQLDKGENQTALETLQNTLPYAAQNAEYQAFFAALLQREARHAEAVEHYQAALQLKPGGVWYMGMGISLQALQRRPEAQDAFQRALNSGALTAELQAFVEQRLKQIQ